MKALMLVSALLASVVSFTQAPAPPSAGWVSLFDGTTLRGWIPEQGAQWRVDGGSIIGDAGSDGWLRSERQFGDFSLKIQFKNAPKGNSGVFLRATKASNTSDPSNPAGGYELQINNEDASWATDSIENFIQRLVPVHPAPGEWHSYDVDLRGDHIVAILDGVKVLDGRHARFRQGYIGLQHHEGNRIEFRGITVKASAP